jgi:predicted DNA-binding antitoxin AbrB/MazE fold protein
MCMSRVIECIFENNVLKPLEKVPLKEGERIQILIKRKLSFEPLKLKEKVSITKIIEIRDESWNSS